MSRKSSTGIYSYSKFPFILNNHAVLFFFLELSNNCRDLSHFVNHLPVATESKNKIYKILMNIIRNPSSTNDTLEELKEIEIIPMVQDANQPLPNELQNDIQLKLNDIIDQCWFMIDDEAKIIQFYAGAARPEGGLREGTPLPAIENFKAAFSDFGEKFLKFSPNLGENIFRIFSDFRRK